MRRCGCKSAHCVCVCVCATYLAVLGEATVFGVEFRRVRTARVGPRGVARRRQGHVAHAQRIEHAQHAQRAANRVAALDAGKRAQLLVLVRFDDVCNGGRKRICLSSGALRRKRIFSSDVRMVGPVVGV